MTRSDHPEETVTASYLDGSLSGDARDAFETHLAGCDSCRAGVALLRTGESAEDATAPPDWIARAKAGSAATPAAGSRPERGRRWFWIAAAASIIVIAGAVLILVRTQGTDSRATAVYRGELAGPFGEISPAPGDEIPFDDLVFRWGEVPGADRYVVDVYGTDARLLASVEVRAPTIELRWPEATSLPVAVPLVWRVRAMTLDRVIAETRPIPIRVR